MTDRPKLSDGCNVEGDHVHAIPPHSTSCLCGFFQNVRTMNGWSAMLEEPAHRRASEAP